jgi:hypothetical protein
LTEPQLSEAFEKWWPDLKSALGEIPESKDISKAKRSERDLLVELLTTVRNMSQQLSSLEASQQWGGVHIPGLMYGGNIPSGILYDSGMEGVSFHTLDDLTKSQPKTGELIINLPPPKPINPDTPAAS